MLSGPELPRQYEVITDPEDIADAYVSDWVEVAGLIGPITPPARVSIEDGKAVLKFTPIGERYRHHVYVWFLPDPKRDIGVLVVKPLYPLYLAGVLAPFIAVNYHVGFVVITGKEEARALLTRTREQARASALAAMQSQEYVLVSPLSILKDEPVFEGILYETPIGRVAFLKNKPWRSIDFITGHEEDTLHGQIENVMTPGEFLEMLAKKILGWE